MHPPATVCWRTAEVDMWTGLALKTKSLASQSNLSLGSNAMFTTMVPIMCNIKPFIAVCYLAIYLHQFWLTLHLYRFTCVSCQSLIKPSDEHATGSGIKQKLLFKVQCNWQLSFLTFFQQFNLCQQNRLYHMPAALCESNKQLVNDMEGKSSQHNATSTMESHCVHIQLNKIT